MVMQNFSLHVNTFFFSDQNDICLSLSCHDYHTLTSTQLNIKYALLHGKLHEIYMY